MFLGHFLLLLHAAAVLHARSIAARSRLARRLMAFQRDISDFQFFYIHLQPTIFITLVGWLVRLLFNQFVASIAISLLEVSHQMWVQLD
mmetsp:Transcript_28185/g.33122  ORF Transcript_28185/g.33122 Transcript_28185/m.33122 type:complete len:89 (-) Transcript_28185:251-517(-)